MKGIQRNLTGGKISTSYQFCDFRADQKYKMDALTSDWLKHFLNYLQKPLNRIQTYLTGSKVWTSSTNFVFFGHIEKSKTAARPLIGWDIFNFSFETFSNGIQWNFTESKILRSSYKIVFSDRSVNNNGHPSGYVKKVAHGIQVHDMWPFGPLVKTQV